MLGRTDGSTYIGKRTAIWPFGLASAKLQLSIYLFEFHSLQGSPKPFFDDFCSHLLNCGFLSIGFCVSYVIQLLTIVCLAKKDLKTVAMCFLSLSEQFYAYDHKTEKIKTFYGPAKLCH